MIASSGCVTCEETRTSVTFLTHQLACLLETLRVTPCQCATCLSHRSAHAAPNPNQSSGPAVQDVVPYQTIPVHVTPYLNGFNVTSGAKSESASLSSLQPGFVQSLVSATAPRSASVSPSLDRAVGASKRKSRPPERTSAVTKVSQHSSNNVRNSSAATSTLAATSTACSSQLNQASSMLGSGISQKCPPNVSLAVSSNKEASPAQFAWNLAALTQQNSSMVVHRKMPMLDQPCSSSSDMGFEAFLQKQSKPNCDESLLMDDSSTPGNLSKHTNQQLDLMRHDILLMEGGKQTKLFEFLWHLLEDEAKYGPVIVWTNRELGEFKLVDSEMVAKLWGMHKGRPFMNYEKMSRILRYYYNKKIMCKVKGRCFVYRFLSVPPTEGSLSPDSPLGRDLELGGQQVNSSTLATDYDWLLGDGAENGQIPIIVRDPKVEIDDFD